jgi:L-alanine-DL-glutamate epimerase-like enolase superfamily enzyme
MKITEIEVIPLQVPLKSDYHVAYGVIKRDIRKVIVKMRTDSGIEGIGEATGVPQSHGDTMEGILATIRDVLAPALIGTDPLNIRGVHEIMDASVHRGQARAAKAALDEAAYDIAGKALGVPVGTLLGGALRYRIPVVPSSIEIGAPGESATQAREGVAKGFTNFKMKGMADPWEDLRRLASVREAIGNDLPIRLDPNEAYSKVGIESVILAVKEMEKYKLTLLESPLQRSDYHGLAQLCQAVSVPIVVHQGNESPEDMVNLIRWGAADLFNITVALIGGIYEGMKMITIAESFGMSVLIGSHWDLGIGTAASAQLASVIRHLPYACDCRFELRYEEDILEVPNRIEGGYTYVPQKPGLGVEIDEAKLRKYRLDV